MTVQRSRDKVVVNLDAMEDLGQVGQLASLCGNWLHNGILKKSSAEKHKSPLATTTCAITQLSYESSPGTRTRRRTSSAGPRQKKAASPLTQVRSRVAMMGHSKNRSKAVEAAQATAPSASSATSAGSSAHSAPLAAEEAAPARKDRDSWPLLPED